MSNNTLYQEAIDLLKSLIEVPSFSKEEDKTAEIIFNYLLNKKIKPQRIKNNIWATNQFYDETKPTILLNSHHDTVKPNAEYSNNPFEAIIKNEKLFGIGSNDAGGSLVSLMQVFLHFYSKENLKYNLVFAATAEEEISGLNGIEFLLPSLPKIDCAIVGEPTQMQLAIAEKGLLVLDCTALGTAGHAARNEGMNAIEVAIKDILWFQSFQFPKKSDWLGEIKMNVTVIETENKTHNIIPSDCKFTVDIRITDCYAHEEVLEIIKENISSQISPRSMRLRSSKIEENHPLVQAGISIGKKAYGSPTSSDKSLMPFPTLKMGPGDSSRSHIANEFIYLKEIEEGIDDYINLLNQLL